MRLFPAHEQAVDAECVADRPPWVAATADEQVAGEQRALDGACECREGAIADADGVGWQVGCVALALEVLCGPAFGLWVGVDDAPG